MLHHWKSSLLAALIAALTATSGSSTSAQDKRAIKMGKLTMVAPKDWVRKEPKFRIIAHEYAAPAAKEDKVDGRMTVMSSGGTIDANITRWYGQFKQSDGGDTKKRSKVEKKKIAGHVVHLVDIPGAYRSFRAKVAAKDYRMLAAIIETKDGNIYIKVVGPKRTIAKHEKAFKKMINDIK